MYSSFRHWKYKIWAAVLKDINLIGVPKSLDKDLSNYFTSYIYTGDWWRKVGDKMLKAETTGKGKVYLFSSELKSSIFLIMEHSLEWQWHPHQKMMGHLSPTFSRKLIGFVCFEKKQNQEIQYASEFWQPSMIYKMKV